MDKTSTITLQLARYLVVTETTSSRAHPCARNPCFRNGRTWASTLSWQSIMYQRIHTYYHGQNKVEQMPACITTDTMGNVDGLACGLRLAERIHVTDEEDS